MTWLADVLAVHHKSRRPAVVDETGAITGAELIGMISAAADLLTALDVVDGAPIPALLTTNGRALALLLAGAAADRPLAPLGPHLTATELAEVVRTSGSRVLLSEPSFVQTADQVAAATGATVVTVADLPVSSTTPMERCTPTAFFLHTSGTTGIPKRVPFTDAVLCARTDVLAGLVGLGPDHRYATGSPLHHIGGLGNVLVAISVGAAVLSTTKFSVDWWRGLRSLDATHCLLVPTMIEMLLTERKLDAVPLQTLIYGAAPISPETLGRVLQVLPNVELVNLFGQTEGSPIASLGPEDHRRAAAGRSDMLRSVGRAVPGLRLRIDAPDTAGVGEVLAAAPHMAVTASDGWLHTGDMGTVDSEGYLFLRGRRHDKVIRGGENVYPLEVEQVLVTHPGIVAAGVVGVPDPRLGETLAAFVVPADPGDPPDHLMLRTFTRARLAGFKVPAYWYVVDSLPLNSSGKVVRPALRDMHYSDIKGNRSMGAS